MIKWREITYAGINGGGRPPPPPPGRPCGAPPGPGRFGIAGAARFVAGGGGGPRPTPYQIKHITHLKYQVNFIIRLESHY